MYMNVYVAQCEKVSNIQLASQSQLRLDVTKQT